MPKISPKKFVTSSAGARFATSPSPTTSPSSRCSSTTSATATRRSDLVWVGHSGPTVRHGAPGEQVAIVLGQNKRDKLSDRGSGLPASDRSVMLGLCHANAGVGRRRANAIRFAHLEIGR